MKKYIFIILSCFISINSHTRPYKCLPSKEYIDNNEPNKFPYSNNLLSDNENLAFNVGKTVVLSGQLIDTNCIPIANAKVLLWQINSEGFYEYQALRNIYNKNLFRKKRTTSFLNAGTTYTDNNGKFSFYTVVPGENKYQRVKFFNIRFKTVEGKEIQTKLFFEDAKKQEKASNIYEYLVTISTKKQ